MYPFLGENIAEKYPLRTYANDIFWSCLLYFLDIYFHHCDIHSGPHMNLKSDRLLIGHFKRADLQEWFLIERDPSVRKYILDGSVLNEEQSLAYIEQNIASYAKFNFGRYALRDKKSSRLIGMCGFLNTDMGIDFGYRLSKDMWGCGLGFEAASAVLAYGIKVIGLNHIVAGVMPENLASIKILERLGFIYQTDVIYERKTYHKYMFSPNKTQGF